MIALVKLPIEAIRAIDHGLAPGRLGILLQDVADDVANLVRAGPDPPAQVADGVVHARRARVANALHSVAGDGAHGRVCVARAHEDGVRVVPKVEASRAHAFLVRPETVSRRRR
jgi:hypothetical protein